MEDNIEFFDKSVPDTTWIKTEIPDSQSLEDDMENRFNKEVLNLEIKTETDPKPNGSEEIQLWGTGSNEESENFLPLEVSFVKGLCSRTYICHHCKGLKRSVSSLKSHIKKRHLPGLAEVVNAEKKRKPLRRRRRRKAVWGRRVKKRSQVVHPCPFCPYKSQHLWVLQNHVLGVHTDSKPSQCPFCHYRSAYARSLVTHIRGVHLKEKPYQCKQCCYSTLFPSRLRSHVRGVHSEERPYQCDVCDYRTAYREALKVHIMANHTGERPYQCPECDYGAVQSSELRLHIINHHRRDLEKPHRCPYCPYRSAQSSHLKTHISAVHIKEPVHKCSQCPYSATYALALQRHIAFTHGSNPKKNNQLNNPSDNSNDYSMTSRENKVFVDQINYLYGQQNYVNSFLYNSVGVEYESDSSNHDSSDGEDPLNTENLEAGNTDSSNKNDEEESNTQGEETPEYLEPIIDISTSGNSGPEIMQVALNPFDYTLPCGIEDQGVISQPKKKRKRKRERNKKNIQEKQYPCPQCDYCFPKSKHLMYHMKAEHPGFKSFPCTQCDFSAPKSSLLKYHVQAVHKAAAGATVHQCPKCPYCTGNVDKLRTHIRVKHNRIRPYKCPQCSYSSTQAGHIKIHVRAKHTDEKPYHCSYCGYQSAYSSALKSHITKRHANN